MSETTYELPLNERIRTQLRLDFLFQQVHHFLVDDSTWGSRAAISAIIDIINVFTRSDLKTDLIKELERLTTCLAPLSGSQGVDQQALSQLLDDMDRQIDRLHAMPAQIGTQLRELEFLNAIRQRNSIPGGSCSFDLPGYHHWLAQDVVVRRGDIQRWLKALEPLRESSELVTRLIRESGRPSQEVAEQGFFQQSLDTNQPFQLVQVVLPAGTPYFAEISGGKHRFSIRIMEQCLADRPAQTMESVPFKLLRCAI